VDRNRLQIDGSTEKVKHLGEMAPKFAAFEWNVLEIDGHDYRAIAEAIAESDRLADASDRPTVIIANTIKGKGVSFMENQAGWHGKAPNREQFEQAATELRAALASLGGWPA
jgi:transketolase